MTATAVQVSKKWQALLTMLPGYDPFVDAGDCWFDEEAAQLACDFYPECLIHIKGPKGGEAFELENWQKAILGNLFGWKRPDGTRRYRTAFILVPRKNGKTPLIAGIVLETMLFDNEYGAEIYSAAADRDQAKLVAGWVKGMIRKNPDLDRMTKIYQHSVQVVNEDGIETGTFYKPISAEAGTKHGYNSHVVVVDELHAQPNSELVEVLETSMGARSQPLMIYITTADYARESICNTTYDYAEKVRDGIIDDRAFLPVIYEATLDDDWTDPKVWAKANPNLGVSVSLDYIQSACRKAQESPAFENVFKRLHLNIQTEQAVRWLQMDKWDACNEPFTPESLHGKACWGGLDLSSKIDLSSLVLVFPPEDENDIYRVLPFFWVPGDSMERRYKKDRVPYPMWQQQGFIEETMGDVVDYSFIRRRVNELGEIYSIQDIGYDPYNATHLAQELADQDGFNMVEFRQGFISMNEPTKEVERLVISKQISHNGNPVMRWMASNVCVRVDAAGNIKPDKEKSNEKIDGIVGLVMGVGRAIFGENQDSVYETRGLLVL